ncbi:hypothetical protein ACFFGH_04085 [Lysobacter korlensis]|uniref:Uncharacterized protein n=1 Tax=Lysobacter korlensis TaxID=553636 RepID=A0ABV6RM30_9GAMM
MFRFAIPWLSRKTAGIHARRPSGLRLHRLLALLDGNGNGKKKGKGKGKGKGSGNAERGRLLPWTQWQR